MLSMDAAAIQEEENDVASISPPRSMSPCQSRSLPPTVRDSSDGAPPPLLESSASLRLSSLLKREPSLNDSNNRSSDVFRTSARSSASSFSSFQQDQNHAPRPARTSNPRGNSSFSGLAEELNRLEFSQLRLYGRDSHLQTLQRAFGRLKNGGENDDEDNVVRNMVILSGESGTGKSSILKEFRRQISQQRGRSAPTASPNSTILIGYGKFEQNQWSVPYSAFSDAFGQLCESLLVFHSESNSSIDCQDTENPLRAALAGSNYELLLDLVPILRRIMEDSDELDRNPKEIPQLKGEEKEMEWDLEHTYDVVKSQQRWKSVLRRFLSAVCKPERKVILIMDDLQWADPASLDLLEFILCEPVLMGSLLVIGAVRSDEVGDGHPFAQKRTKIEQALGQRVEEILVETLQFDSVHNFITDLLCLGHFETESLAKIAFKKVQGNPFFLVQFLTALRDGKYLAFNVALMRWTWNETEIRKSTVVADNVLAMVLEKMSKLPESQKRVLKITSCLGSSFEEDVVDIVAKGLEDSTFLPKTSYSESTHNVLEALVQEDLLESLKTSNSQSAQSYCFSHDQIELATQCLLDETTILLLKFKIGEILCGSKARINYESVTFIVTDLWNESRELLSTASDIELLVEMNYQAGMKALASSAFEASIHYFRCAIDLIPSKDRWDDQQLLTLKLYNSLMKAEYSNGNWIELQQNIDTILHQERLTILQKVDAYSLWITTLSYQDNKHGEAIELAVKVLKELGVTFHPRLGKIAIATNLIKTKLLLRKKPLESVLKAKDMDDGCKQAAMEVMTTVNSSLYAANPDLYMCTVLKITRWSLKYGLNKYCSRSIGLYGLVEMALGNAEAGTKACDIAVQLAEQQGIMKSELSPSVCVYGFVYPWTKPLHVCQRELLSGYRVGLETGDLEHAAMNVVVYCSFCYSSGKAFSNLEADMRDYAVQMKLFNMTLQLKFLCLTWQTILNLMGRSEASCVLSGEAMKQEEILKDADKDDNRPLRAQLFCHRLQLAVYFGEYELAASFLDETGAIEKVNPAHPIIWRTALFEGVTAFEMVRRGQKRWKRLGAKSISRVQQWVDGGNPNCVHILFLLQAEKLASELEVEKAKELYDKTIAAAGRSGFLNDGALASERCGEMLQATKGMDSQATGYFQYAFDTYVELEAIGKADQMKKRYSALDSAISGSIPSNVVPPLSVKDTDMPKAHARRGAYVSTLCM